MSIRIAVSVGELLDKITILQIKSERISDFAKLENVNKEYKALQTEWLSSSYLKLELDDDIKALKRINEELWDIEDQLRDKEKKKAFDEAFIALARAVYIANDKRAAIKRRINNKAGSELVEEKSYSDYSVNPA